MGQQISYFVFQPPPISYGKEKNLIWLHTPKNDTISNRNYSTLLFSHGNAEDLGMIVDICEDFFNKLKVNVFAYDYSGYGLSSGYPSEENIYSGSDAAYNYLTQKMNIPPSKIIPYGRSLGSAASIHLGVNYPVLGLILQSPLLSVFRVAFNVNINLPGDMFCNISKIGKVKCPVFIIHGMEDKIVPFVHGLTLYKECLYPYKPYWVEKAGHNNIEIVARKEFFQKIKNFIILLNKRRIKIIPGQKSLTKPSFNSFIL